MTVVENLTPRVQYNYVAEQQQYPITFPYIERQYVKCMVGNTLLTYNIDYQIPAFDQESLDDNELYLTLLITPEAGSVITIYRATTFDQQAEFPQEAKFSSQKITEALDKLTHQQQEQQDDLNTCLRLSKNIPVGFNTELPSPAANQVIQWNEDGTQLINYDLRGEIETIDAKADEAIDTAEEANTKSNTAVATANTANTNAANAVATANTANTNAANAVATANQAASDATSAVSTANTAVSTANTASQIATAASDKVDSFGEDIEEVIEAAEKINELEEAVETATQKADVATQKANIASYYANSAVTASQIASTAATNAETAATKVTTAIQKTMSNCITEIPQDIILELNNGTLTLKAGSKVYVPNGFETDGTTSKFYSVTIENDLTITDEYSRNVWIGVTPDGSAIVKGIDSETGTPEANTYKYYYDPSTNLCYLNTGASSIPVSLPICIATSDNSGIIGLSNIFNGLGYIGSTAFVLPGVKTLRPYLRNADGTLRSVETTTSTVLMKTNIYGANDYYLMFDGVNIYLPAKNTVHYDFSNCWYDNSNMPLYWVSLGELSCDTNNNVTDFKPKTTFYAADYNDINLDVNNIKSNINSIETDINSIETSLGNKANKDFSNLTSQGQNISNWSSNVSNCITEIPQNIILELNNGTLTLKAGSKVYVPNGFETDGTTPNFDTVTIPNDITTTDSASRNIWVGVNLDGSAMVFGVDSETGTPALNTYKYYYDPSANMCYLNVGASSIQASLPICIATSDSSGIVALPNVFNGLGYIGSTVFVLPNVSVLRAYLKNTDGTLRSVKSTISTVLMKTSTNGANDYYLMFDGTDIYLPAKNTINYDVSNCWYDSTNTALYWASLGEFSCDAGNIVNAFEIKTVFHAADYNDVWVKQDTHVVVETYSNGTSWYRVYSDGWCEQGGQIVQTDDTYFTVTFLKPFANTNYVIFKNQPYNSNSPESGYHAGFYNFTNSTAQTRIYAGENSMWKACGYIS